MTSSKPPTAQPPMNPGARFKEEIIAAIASGAASEDLVLSLTLMDASKIKRDPSVADEDVSFSSGEMRYLGVLVKQGGVRASQLGLISDLPAAEPVAAEPPKKTRAKRAPAKRAAATSE